MTATRARTVRAAVAGLCACGAVFAFADTARAGIVQAVRSAGTVTGSGSYDSNATCTDIGVSGMPIRASFSVAPLRWHVTVAGCMIDVARPTRLIDGTFALAAPGGHLRGTFSGSIGLAPFNSFAGSLAPTGGNGQYAGFAGTTWIKATASFTDTSFSVAGVSYGGFGPRATTVTRLLNGTSTLSFATPTPAPECASGLRSRATGTFSVSTSNSWGYVVDGCTTIAPGQGQAILAGTLTVTTSKGTAVSGTAVAFEYSNGNWYGNLVLTRAPRQVLGGFVNISGGTSPPGAATGVVTLTRSPIR